MLSFDMQRKQRVSRMNHECIPQNATMLGYRPHPSPDMNLSNLATRETLLIARGSFPVSLQEKFEWIMEQALPDMQ